METLAICLVLYAALFFLDIVPSVHQRQWKALKAAVPIFLLSLGVLILWGLNVPVPNPNDYLKRAILAILHNGKS